MNNRIQAEAAVRFDSGGIRIHGKPELLLCASLFYFRVPRAYWKERMEQLVSFGYNAIDVYFPWNYHERYEGSWDFDGERDAGAFLKAAKECGLWVVARPGPYICSEWDGGALPAYLLADDDIRLRDNDTRFLEAVSRWFDRILPIIKSYEAGAGGTVVAVQLDNELDFYGCSDPAGYIAAIKDMALAQGITVPLFACAGQGGIIQATGLAPGVMPTCNFYPNDRDPSFEEKVLRYGSLLRGMGYPLLVTETNRSHYLLRRLLSCGAKLLGPYLQVSGTDFGFTNATNNWGKPLAFMTSDYDFQGMISPEGHLREEAYEGRLLRRLMDAYGTPLAEAEPRLGPADHGDESGDVYKLHGESNDIAGPFVLRLKGGGELLFVTNLDDCSKAVQVMESDQGELSGDGFTLSGGRSLILPVDVPLGLWGMEGRLLSSTAELYRAVKLTSGATVIAFHTEGAGMIRLRLPASSTVYAEGGEVERDGEQLTYKFDGGGAARLAIHSDSGNGGERLIVVVHSREMALFAEEPDELGIPDIRQPLRYAIGHQPAVQQWRISSCDIEAALRTARTVKTAAKVSEEARLDRPEPLEKLGVYRGFAWFEGNVELPAGVRAQGLLLRQASDVVSLYAEGSYVGTAAPGGGSRFIPFGERKEIGSLLARTEIWGHSNFDDIRLPGLRLKSGKGLTGIAAITRVAALSSNWRVCRAADRSIRPELAHADADRSLWPMVGFGGWLSPDHPAFEYYSRSFTASADADSWTLRFEGLQARARLFVGGKDAGEINPFDPYLDITSFVNAGEEVELTVFLERALGLPAGGITLYEGVEAGGWAVRAAEEQELLETAETSFANSSEAVFPLELEPGAVAWLYAESVNSTKGKGWRAMIEGSGLKLTAFLEETLVGRLWLPGGEERPVLTGGSSSSVYLPGAWFKDGKGRLSFMLEAVDRAAPGCLNAVSFVPVQQLE